MVKEVRKNSLITNKKNIEHLYTIKKFPVFIGNTNQPIKDDLYFDLTFDICKDTGLIQLRKLIKPEIIYSKYHSEAIGSIWENHHKTFSELILTTIKNIKKNNLNVFEIGGSNGKLGSMVLKIDNDDKIKNWNIIEPNAKPNNSLDNKITFINSFFEESFITKNTNIDVIVHSHTIEHMYDTNMFINNISKSLSNDGYNIFSIPNLKEYLKNNFINTLNFEHTLFLTEDIIDFLLNEHNLKIIDKIYYTNHSIFYITKKIKNTKKYKLNNQYIENKELYLSCINHHLNFVKKINNKLKKFNGDVYLFGGHIFSQFLIKLGLNTEKIKYVLDNSTLKHNTRLYGSNIYIKNPSLINIHDNSAIILKVGQYRDEIINGLKQINNNIIIWE